VYLVAYVESVNTFLAVDVRDLVDARWGENFYAEIEELDQQKITVHIPVDTVLDAERVAAMVKHRSMRIDGPAFRGRPLGHRLDPLRSELALPEPNVWLELVQRILQAHDFEEQTCETVDNLTVVTGVLHQTLLWQSPAFTEIGWGPEDQFRTEAPPEQLFGQVCIFLGVCQMNGVSGIHL